MLSLLLSCCQTLACMRGSCLVLDSCFIHASPRLAASSAVRLSVSGSELLPVCHHAELKQLYVQPPPREPSPITLCHAVAYRCAEQEQTESVPHRPLPGRPRPMTSPPPCSPEAGP